MIEDPSDTSAGREVVPGSRTVRIPSTDLFQGHREVVIVHRGQEYRLHITKANKLILTK